MRNLVISATLVLLAAGPAFAQRVNQTGARGNQAGLQGANRLRQVQQQTSHSVHNRALGARSGSAIHSSPHGFARANMTRTRDAVGQQQQTSRAEQIRNQIYEGRGLDKNQTKKSIFAMAVTIPAVATVMYAVHQLGDVMFAAPW